MTTKEEVKALWKLCFNDSDEFVDLYFKKRYKDDINVAIRRDGKVVSALQTVPYPMTFCGGTIATSYISGACTHPDYRNQGLMRQLLTDTHRRMYEKGVLVGMLIPAKKELFDYYAKSGYAPVFGYARLKRTVKDLYFSPLYTVQDEKDEQALLSEHFRYFSQTMKKRSCCVLHPKDDFLIIRADLRLSKGKLLVARRGGLICGMAFVVKAEEGLVVKELLADNDVIKESLMKRAAELFEVDEVECLMPSFMDTLYLGMARIIHAEQMLALVACKYPEIEMQIQIVGDTDLPENNGYYVIRQGTCTREYCPSREYRVCKMSEFTRLLLEAEHPYMSLMLD